MAAFGEWQNLSDILEGHFADETVERLLETACKWLRDNGKKCRARPPAGLSWCWQEISHCEHTEDVYRPNPGEEIDPCGFGYHRDSNHLDLPKSFELPYSALEQVATEGFTAFDGRLSDSPLDIGGGRGVVAWTKGPAAVCRRHLMMQRADVPALLAALPVQPHAMPSPTIPAAAVEHSVNAIGFLKLLFDAYGVAASKLRRAKGSERKFWDEKLTKKFVAEKPSDPKTIVNWIEENAKGEAKTGKKNISGVLVLFALLERGEDVEDSDYLAGSTEAQNAAKQLISRVKGVDPATPVSAEFTNELASLLKQGRTEVQRKKKKPDRPAGSSG